MKKIDSFINQYPLSKTLRFSLIPVGKTEENFNRRLLLEEDKKRSVEYVKVKTYIDRYHKDFIESVLSNYYIDGIREYSELYYKPDKSDKDLKALEKTEAVLRKKIASALTTDSRYKAIFGKEMITELLPGYLTDKEELASVEMFRSFATYFKGFNDNRANMYSSEAQSTAISYRCINDNLPKFLDNAKSFKAVKAALSSEKLEALNRISLEKYGIAAEDIFSLDYYSFTLSQKGINRYNTIIGGYTDDNHQKIQGINELINLYNQQEAKGDKSRRLPLMKILYKQILSDRTTPSFIPEKFESDNAVIDALKQFYKGMSENVLGDMKDLFKEFSSFDPEGIYVVSGPAVTDISNSVFGSWSAISDAWNTEYEKAFPLKKGKDPEKYYEEEKKAYKRNASFSIAELQRLGTHSAESDNSADITRYFSDTVVTGLSEIASAYDNAKALLSCDYENSYNKKLYKNDSAITLIKALLDGIKSLEKTVKPLRGSEKEENRDSNFYARFNPLYAALSEVDSLYDKVRNYMTQKPYSTEKIKLNFKNPQFLGGWDKNKERDYLSVLLTKDGNYYLAVMDKSNNKAFLNPPTATGGDVYQKMDYKLLPGPNKMLPKVFFAASNIDHFAPSEKILEIRKKESFKKGVTFNIDDCHAFIDFFKESINRHSDWSQFGFKFSDTNNYSDISEFYKEVLHQGYTIKFNDIPTSYIDDLVNKGQLYLFQIYNKDFSSHSTGKENLHTMYFKMLFDERNLADVVYKLNGEAEMFYREASIGDDEMIVHHANEPIPQRSNKQKTSIYPYDIIKNKRYTKRQFSLHVPITLNFKADGQNFINESVRKVIKHSDSNYVIGIDRGERNLLYICVINDKGEIVYQKSLNEIVTDRGQKVDYHQKLQDKEAARDNERKSWGNIENIKELKEGYLSQVIHEICSLVLEYDAVIAMEDLNFGFKKGRFCVEKQVYQKFENMLITKLNYLVSKDRDASENGGLLRAYQLTNKVDGVNKGRQNGIIFYVPAYLTSKIDPTTGFADLLKPRYTSVNDSIDFIRRIDDIRYNADEDLFEFDIDYLKFPKTNASYKKQWTVCTNGKRIRTFRNKDKNSMWDNEEITLTNEFKKLFESAGIDCSADIKGAMLQINNADFHRSFMHLLSLVLQMRNSITGDVDTDYLISPVRNSSGEFYCSNNYEGENASLPANADANGAYHIARKALWAIDVLKNTPDDELRSANLSISNADWFEYVQNE